jgi:hypothetical protein
MKEVLMEHLPSRRLPDNAADANAVIQALQSLVDTWMHPERDHPAPSKVIALVRDKD